MEKNASLERLIKNFQKRHEKSQDKKTLIDREIEAHELLFDDKKFPVWMHSNNRPLAYLNLNAYTDGEIIGVRDAYIKFIVNGADINDTGKYFVVRKESINKDEDDWYIDGKGRFCKKMPPTAFQIHYYNEAKTRYLYLIWLRNYNMQKKESEKFDCVLKNESVILKLFEEFKDNFPEETKEVWKQRWNNRNDTLPSIKIDSFKYGNNKHLLLTILHEAHPFIRVDKIQDYTKIRWGLKSYHRDITIYLNDRDAKPHPELNKIKEILKPELF